jgi:hypothetical protein
VSSTFEQIQSYLPNYLSDESQRKLVTELKKAVQEREGFYTSALEEKGTLFQGDCFENFLAPHPGSGTTQRCKVFLISNTCDVSLANKRLFRPNLTLAPILSLDKYRQSLEQNHPTKHTEIASHIESIRRQEISSFFYMPALEGGELFVRFDNIFSMTLNAELQAQMLIERLSTLSDAGFYLLTLKLGIHFCRVHEKVDRGNGQILGQ